MTNVEIRRVTLSDINLLQNISKQTFTEAFSEQNSEENMAEYLSQGFSIEKLKRALTDQCTEFYFALFNDKIIGYLKINFGHSQSEIKNENALEIERIYVLKVFQGKKVGQLLLGKSMTIAREKRVNYVWLGVWEENPGAIRFYQKNGFVEFDRHIFKLGNEDQMDIMMKLQLE